MVQRALEQLDLAASAAFFKNNIDHCLTINRVVNCLADTQVTERILGQF